MATLKQSFEDPLADWEASIQLAKPKTETPVLFRKKKDMSLHLCMDYRSLKMVCENNICPLLLMKDMLAYLAKRKIF